MPRIANKDFQLIAPNGKPTNYKAGDVIAADHEAHWYAEANSDEQKGATVAAAAVEEPQEEAPRRGRPAKNKD